MKILRKTREDIRFYETIIGGFAQVADGVIQILLSPIGYHTDINWRWTKVLLGILTRRNDN